MPQARSGGSGRSSSGRSSSGRSTAGRSSSSGAKRGSSRSSTSRSRSSATSRSRSTGASRSRSARSGGSSADARVQRLRKLNERIIEASREAGEATLASYESALKAIARAIERGPGASDIEWVSNLATAQAKFLRDLTKSTTSAARKMLT